MQQTSSRHWDDSLEIFLKEFTLSWNEDCWIVEKYLMPLFDSFVLLQPHHRHLERWGKVREVLTMINDSDNRTPPVNSRHTQDIRDRVKI